MPKAIRFYGKVIKSARGPVVVETEDGRYEFDRADLVDVKPYNTKMDEILIHENAAVTFKSTVAKILKRDRTVYGNTPPSPSSAPESIRAGLMWNGSHEWRG